MNQMVKINKQEYQVLKSLDDKWEWIARDKSGLLLAHSHKLSKRGDSWETAYSHFLAPYFFSDEKDKMFQFVQWEDEEPHNIAELIGEYESEETEVKKNIDWLRREIHKELESWCGVEGGIDGDGINEIILLINQLETEVLSSDWINKHSNGPSRSQYIWVDDLKKILVPKQPKITLQDIRLRLWELPSGSRKYWLEQLNNEFQKGYFVPLGLKTTDGEEQYLTYNGSYFASRRDKRLQQTFDTLEEIPEFYRDLAERVI